MLRPVWSKVVSPDPGTPGALAYVRYSVKLPRICGLICMVMWYPKTGHRKFGFTVWVRRYRLNVDMSGGRR